MKVENIKLKSCPFCGGEAEFLCTEGPVVLWCTQCGMESDGFESKEKAAYWWNTRAGEPANTEVVHA